MYLFVFLAGVSILIIFRILPLINKNLPYQAKIRQYVTFLLPVAEIIAWMGLIIWFFKHAYNEKDHTSLIILAALIIFLIIPAWYLSGDFLLGVILKIQRKIEVNTRIEIGDINGVVKKAGHFSFDIETREGTINTIPYHQIKSKVISRPSTNINLEKQLIRFQFTSRNNINNMLPRLKASIMNSPWSAVSIDPIIYEIRKENDEAIVDVFVFTLKQEHAEMIREYVLKKLTESQIGESGELSV